LLAKRGLAAGERENRVACVEIDAQPAACSQLDSKLCGAAAGQLSTPDGSPNGLFFAAYCLSIFTPALFWVWHLLRLKDEDASAAATAAASTSHLINFASAEAHFLGLLFCLPRRPTF
jgi:hypothetical protein